MRGPRYRVAQGHFGQRIRLRHEREEFDKETRRLLDASNEAFRNEFRVLCEALGTCAREIEAQTGRTLVDGDTAYGAFMVFDKPVTVQLFLPEELYREHGSGCASRGEILLWKTPDSGGGAEGDARLARPRGVPARQIGPDSAAGNWLGLEVEKQIPIERGDGRGTDGSPT